MKLSFDSRDFTNSALSLAAGMLLVTGLAAWRSGGDISILSLTLGLPVGVLSFWAMYAMKMRAAEGERRLFNQSRHKGQAEQRSHERQPIPPTERPTYPALTLEVLRANQRMRSLKGRALQVQTDEQERPSLDQWHQ